MKLVIAARKAIKPAVDDLLGLVRDAIAEREKLAGEKAAIPTIFERLVRPLLYVATGAVIGALVGVLVR